MITVSFNVGKEDALALAAEYYAHSPTVRRGRLWGHLAVPVVMVGLGIIILGESSADKTGAIPVFGWGLVWALFYPKYHAWNLMRTAERMYNESSFHNAFGTYKVTLSEDGMVSSSPVGEGRYAWPAVTRVVLTARHLLIFLSGPQGYAIPRKELPDSTIQEMKAFAETRMRRAEPGATRNVNPAERVGSSGVDSGPPSVS